MKKFIFLFIIFFLSLPSFAKNDDRFDVNSQNFSDLGRYIQTLELNDNYSEPSDSDLLPESEDNFEEEVILDVAQRYEQNAVVLNLEDNASNAMSDVNDNRVFALRVNETKYLLENAIRNENMIWDSDKVFSQAFLSDTRHMAPIPGVVNSQSVSATVSPSVSASFGQTFLYDSNGPSVLFVRANESTYNTGSVISYKADGMNLSVGSFSSSYNHEASGGAILSSDSLILPKNAGKFVLGGAYFANEGLSNDKITGGGFIEYTFKRFKLNAQIGQSKYTKSSDYLTSLYLIPEFRISDSLYLTTRFIRNITQDTMQDEFALTYKPKNSKCNFEFEINAMNQYTPNSQIKQRIKLSTSFKI